MRMDGGALSEGRRRFRVLAVGALVTASVVLGAVGSSQALTMGDHVQVRPTGQMAVNGPAVGGVIGTRRGVQPSNAPGVITGGPVQATIGGILLTWWEVNFDTGVDGWIDERGLVMGKPKPPAKVTLNAVPFTTVNKVGVCADNSPAGANIVTAAWLKGMGLPDNGGDNVDLTPPIDDANNPNKADHHFGLLFSKNGTTNDCSTAGAEITNVGKLKLTAPLVLGYDFRNGSHCGPFAPRFEVVVLDGTSEKTHVLGGCEVGSMAPADQDPAQWTEVRFDSSDAGQAFPPITPGATVKKITIFYDEGTDLPSFATDDLIANPAGIGLAVIDNIFIDGTLITRDDHHGYGHDYRKQGRKQYRRYPRSSR